MENININSNNEIEIDSMKLHKIIFLYNALENGWTVKKNKEFYIFNKAHGGKKEVYLDDYLTRFMQDNFDMSTIN